MRHGKINSANTIVDPLVLRDSDQGVSMTYAATGSSGIIVADNNNIDFGTGNFTLCWKGSLPDWTPGSVTDLISKANPASVGIRLYADGAKLYNLAGTGPTTITFPIDTPFIDGTVHEITETFEVGAVNTTVTHYFDGFSVGSQSVANFGTVSSVSDLQVLGVGAVRALGIVNHAYTFNRALIATEVLDLYRNGIAESDKWGSATELIINQTDRDFSGANNWLAGTMNSFNASGDLSLAASAPGQYSRIHFSYAPLTYGKRYRIEFDLANYAGGWQLTDYAQYIGFGYVTLGNGHYKLEFVNSNLSCFGGICIGALAANSTGDFDNFTIVEIGATLALDPEGIQYGRWLDSSSNDLTGIMPATGWNLTKQIPTPHCQTNLLTNTQWGAMNGNELTVEVNATAIPTDFNIGSSFVTGNDSTFAGAGNWVDGAGWSVTGGVHRAGAGTATATELTINGFTVGKLYKFSIYISAYTYTGGTMILYATDSSGGTALSTNGPFTPTATKYCSVIWKATETTHKIKCVPSVALQVDLDTALVYEVTPGYVTANNVAPDGWIKNTNAKVWREHSGSNTKSGSFYACKITGTSNIDLYTPSPVNSPVMMKLIEGRQLTFGSWVKSDAANQVRLCIADGTTTTYSSYNVGTGYEWLELSVTIDTSDPSALNVGYYVVNTKTAYISQPMLVFGSSIGVGNYQLIPNEYQLINAAKPAFYYTLTNNLTNVTGNDVTYQVRCLTKVFDQNNNVENGVFTAPITGRYFFRWQIYCNNVIGGTTHTVGIASIYGSNRGSLTYMNFGTMASAPGNIVVETTAFIDMDAGDTAYPGIQVFGGSQDVGVYATTTCFSGFLVC